MLCMSIEIESNYFSILHLIIYQMKDVYEIPFRKNKIVSSKYFISPYHNRAPLLSQ